jgi:hypothetical protein
MRDFHTSVVELRQPFQDTVASEPYECGWAQEAIFFITVEDVDADFDQLGLRVQISADGIRWTDEGTTASISGPGLTPVRIRHFGGWLRISGELSGGARRAVLSVRLVLKG